LKDNFKRYITIKILQKAPSKLQINEFLQKISKTDLHLSGHQ